MLWHWIIHVSVFIYNIIDLSLYYDDSDITDSNYDCIVLTWLYTNLGWDDD